MRYKNVAVVGAAGFAGIELVRHILNPPGLRLIAVSSDSDAGKLVTELYPALVGHTKLKFVEHSAIESMSGLDAVFLAVPHTAAMKTVAGLLRRGIAVFDLSADFRLKDPQTYEQWYGAKHTAPELLDVAIYGMPEINRSLLNQKYVELVQAEQGICESPQILVACPGCYPTASILALAPALVAGYADPSPVIINAISGVSGAGRALVPGNQYCAVDESLKAYGVTTHRHTPEIAQLVAWEAGIEMPVVFTPHLAPLKRGLLSTATLRIASDVTSQDIYNIYTIAYESERFVHLLAYGQMPQTSSVTGTNNAHVGLAFDEQSRTLVASCAIDNLGKGAASQAIQCANIVFGFEESLGLNSVAGVL